MAVICVFFLIVFQGLLFLYVKLGIDLGFSIIFAFLTIIVSSVICHYLFDRILFKESHEARIKEFKERRKNEIKNNT